MSLPLAPFIIGVGRSGTTLLRLMLDAHPELAIPPETHFLHRLHPESQLGAADFMTIVTQAHTWGDFHMVPEALAAALPVPFDLSAAIRTFYDRYAWCQGKPRWGDKTPYYAECMSHIYRLLPESRFIHIIRDGRDVALSYRDKWFGPGKDLREAAGFWRGRIERARDQAHGLPAQTYLEIRYEDLVHEPRLTLERIAAHCDLAFDPAMLDYHLTAAGRLDEIQDHRNGAGEIAVPRDRHLAIHRNTCQPPDPTQIGKWRQVFSVSERAIFAEEAGDLLLSLGYEP